MANQNGQGDEKKGGKGVLIAGAVVIVGLAATVAVMGSLLLNRPEPVVREPEEELPPQRSMLVTEDNLDEVISELETPPANVPQYFTANMNSTWTFPDGRTSADAYVGNFPGNETPIYFDVSLAETGETIFESPVIPLGSQLNGITLNRALDDGTYSGDLVYHLIDENQRTLTTVTMGVTLIVGVR